MNRKTTKWQCATLLFAIASGMPLTGCVDDSYDMSKDIDLTMELGTDGLQLKLGSTEKIMLADILEVDNTLKTDANNNYYLVEKGNTAVDFNVSSFSIHIDNSRLTPSQEIINYSSIAGLLPFDPGVIDIPAGYDFVPPVPITAETDLNYEVDNIASEIKWIKEVKLAENTRFKIHLDINQTQANFVLKDIKGLKIQFPSYIKIINPVNSTFDEATGLLTFNDRIGINSASVDIGEATIDRLILPGEEGKITNNTLKTDGQKIGMTGHFSFTTLSNFQIKDGTSVNINLFVSLGNRGDAQSEVVINSVTGRFDPKIDPNIESIDISDDLPDFLQDEEVTVKVANPTIHFSADMTNIPVSLNVSAGLEAIKNGQTTATVRMPENGMATATKHALNDIYFYQDETTGPFDPNGVRAGAEIHRVSNLSSLVTKLPDLISVNVKNNSISLKDEDCTIHLGRRYDLMLDYNLYVPFTFESGLKIVYTDSVEDINKDIQDYEAEGATVTASVYNTVPLDLTATAEAVDVQGNIIPGIHITTAHIAAANSGMGSLEENAVTSDITLDVKLNNPADLKKLERLRLRIAAESVQKGTLSSDQYLMVKDMRLKLKGNVIADFNDN